MTIRTFQSAAVLAAILSSALGRAEAKDLWVSPTHVEAAGLDSVFPVTGLGLARFSFAVPDDMSALASARLVFLPSEARLGEYSVFAEVKRNGETISAADIGSSTNVAVAFTAHVLTEVDLSGVLSGLLDGSSAGNDLVGLVVFADSGSIPSAKVLGLRIVYDPKPLSTPRFANGGVRGEDIADGAVVTADLASGAIDSSKVANGSVTRNDIASASLTGADIQDRGLTGLDFQTASVSGTEIANGTVALTDLAANAVDSSRIVNGAVTGAEVADGSLGSADIGSVTAADFAPATLTGVEFESVDLGGSTGLSGLDIATETLHFVDFALDTVDTTKIAASSVVSSDLQDGTIGADDLASNVLVGRTLSPLRTLQVSRGNLDARLGEVCDVAGAGYEPLGVSAAHNFDLSGSVACGGDNLCFLKSSFDRNTFLSFLCPQGGGGDCVVYCIAP